MTQKFAKFRNKEEELKRVNMVKKILGTSIDVAYGLPSGISISIPGPIIDDVKRKSIEQLEWRVWYDMYKDRSYIIVPYARKVEIRRLFSSARWFFVLCVLFVCLKLVYLYVNKDKIIIA